jgi:hypothetical protein
MSAQVETCNFAEALYLLQRGHQVAGVHMACTWPYGHEECAVVFEGGDPEADRLHFLGRMAEYDLSGLPELFAEISAVLQQGGEP